MAENHARFWLDDGSGVNPPAPPLGSAGNPLQVGGALAGSFSTPAQRSTQELLAETNALLRIVVKILYELPLALNATGPAPPSEEPDALLAELLNPATALSNLQN